MLWILLAGGGIVIPLAWALQVWSARRQQLRSLDGQDCPICHTSYEDAILQHRGPVQMRDKQQLDKFQQRYASFVVHCSECASDLVYTREGDFIKRLRDPD